MVSISEILSDYYGLKTYEREAKDNAIANDFKNFQGPARQEQNYIAYTHAYISAALAYDNGWTSYYNSSKTLGNLREYQSFVTDTIKALSGREGYSVDGVLRDGHRDLLNNTIGIQIAEYAKRYDLPRAALGHGLITPQPDAD